MAAKSEVSKLDVAECTIVVVDMQNDFCHPDGKLVQRGLGVTPPPESIAQFAEFIDSARQFGVPIVWIQTSRDESTNSQVWRSRHSLFMDPPAEELREPSCIRGSWGEEFYGVFPSENEPVVTKIRYSAFVGSSLEIVLRTIGRKSLLFTGTATNGCVESTLREALFRDFHVTLVADCCFAVPPSAQSSTIENVRLFFGPVVDHDEVLKTWRVTSTLDG